MKEIVSNEGGLVVVTVDEGVAWDVGVASQAEVRIPPSMPLWKLGFTLRFTSVASIDAAIEALSKARNEFAETSTTEDIEL